VASAQAPYPSRTVTLVCRSRPAAAPTTTTRIISKELAPRSAVGMVIDNKAGANGSIAASYVARPHRRLHAVRHHQHDAFGQSVSLKTMSYDPVKDFHADPRTGDLPSMLVIQSEIPANSSPNDRAGEEEPGKYSYASGSSSAIVSARPLPPRRHRSLARALQEFAAALTDVIRRPHLHDVRRCADRPAPRQRQGAQKRWPSLPKTSALLPQLRPWTRP